MTVSFHRGSSFWLLCVHHFLRYFLTRSHSQFLHNSHTLHLKTIYLYLLRYFLHFQPLRLNFPIRVCSGIIPSWLSTSFPGSLFFSLVKINAIKKKRKHLRCGEVFLLFTTRQSQRLLHLLLSDFTSYGKVTCSLLYVNSTSEMIPEWITEGREELSDDRCVWDWVK